MTIAGNYRALSESQKELAEKQEELLAQKEKLTAFPKIYERRSILI